MNANAFWQNSVQCKWGFLDSGPQKCALDPTIVCDNGLRNRRCPSRNPWPAYKATFQRVPSLVDLRGKCSLEVAYLKKNCRWIGSRYRFEGAALQLSSFNTVAWLCAFHQHAPFSRENAFEETGSYLFGAVYWRRVLNSDRVTAAKCLHRFLSAGPRMICWLNAT